MQARINGVQLGYDDFGQGPVVLFIHDYLLDRHVWRPQVEPLVAAGFRVILTDLHGCGESDLNNEPVMTQTYSAYIIGLLDYLGIGRAAVCELSLGGSVLWNLLENFPQRIAGAYLATSQSTQTQQSNSLVSILKINGQSRSKHFSFGSRELPILQTGAECNPITHHNQTEKRIGDSLVDMENVREFNSHLLEFLVNLAPRKKRDVATPFSSAA